MAFWVNCHFSRQDFSKKIKTPLISVLELKAQVSDETVKPEFHSTHILSIFNTIIVVPSLANVNILKIHPADGVYTVFIFFVITAHGQLTSQRGLHMRSVRFGDNYCDSSVMRCNMNF